MTPETYRCRDHQVRARIEDLPWPDGHVGQRRTLSVEDGARRDVTAWPYFGGCACASAPALASGEVHRHDGRGRPRPEVCHLERVE